MVKRIKSKVQICILLIVIFSAKALCQADNEYQVYALRFNESGYIPARDIAVGTSSADSVSVCNMFWYLKGSDGRNILVDTGFIDPADTGNSNYERPDIVLKRINVSPSVITDIIITHPHPDHIGGVLLFPGARVWMQREDFLYFVSGKWKKEGSLAEFTENDVRNIIEISLQGRLELIEGDDIEIIPGIKVFTGSKHTYENQYLLVNSESKTNRIVIASDAIWFYFNLDNLLPIPTYAFDPDAYVEAMKRMTTMVKNPDLIIPGHDNLVFSRFPEVCEGVVKIGDGIL
jgi:glyoxylase-like metal-dependent hydrolase (beta-lactamase superfamily II)